MSLEADECSSLPPVEHPDKAIDKAKIKKINEDKYNIIWVKEYATPEQVRLKEESAKRQHGNKVKRQSLQAGDEQQGPTYRREEVPTISQNENHYVAQGPSQQVNNNSSADDATPKPTERDSIQKSCSPALLRCLRLDSCTPAPYIGDENDHRVVSALKAGFKFPQWLGEWIKSGTLAMVGIFDIELSDDNMSKVRKNPFGSLESVELSEGQWFKSLQLITAFAFTAVILPLLLTLAALGFNVDKDSGIPKSYQLIRLFSNAAVLVLWIIHLIFSFHAKYVSSSRLILIQDIACESSVCLLASVNSTDVFNDNYYSVGYVNLCTVTLLLIWLLRFYFGVKFSKAYPSLSNNLLFMFVGHSTLVLTLLLMLYKTSVSESQNLPLRITIGILTTVSCVLNAISFYISYLYELTKMSAQGLIDQNGDNRTVDEAKQLVSDLYDLPNFNKMFFALSFPKVALCVFFWPLLIITVLLLSSWDTFETTALVIYCFLLLIFNNRMVAMSLLLYLTLFLIIVFTLAVVLLIFLVGVPFYVLCGLPYGIIKASQ